jgi:hypothetical protein
MEAFFGARTAVAYEFDPDYHLLHAV